MNPLAADQIQEVYENIDQYQLVDISSPSEYAREHIEQSINIPMDQLQSASDRLNSNKRIIFLCQMGSRTKSAAQTIETLPGNEKFCLEGGLVKWKQLGLPTVLDKKAPIEIMRQVQIIAGSLIILGVVLGYTISPWFILLDLFIGCGLLFAGITGFCGMAKLLAYLPYNKIS